MKNYHDLGFAKVDLQRKKIKGHPEVIFCKGKTPQQVAKIASVLFAKKNSVLATKADAKTFKEVKKVIPNAIHHTDAKLITIAATKKNPKRSGTILVVTAGTTDIPVAEEAVITAEFMGNRVIRLYDVGVAGLHRLLSNVKKIRSANVIVVVAGMEGALASVVSGLTTKPVIAVPTSVGYGSHFRGVAPLLSMLNSCSPGVAVMNIDNGFGAGYFASIINKK
jgi:NCAIR mutase (PurE)-related protein